MGRLQTGFVFLGFAALFALIVWWNHKTGIAVGNWAVRADRKTNPIGFWILQVFWSFLAAFSALGGVLIVFFGIGPATKSVPAFGEIEPVAQGRTRT